MEQEVWLPGDTEAQYAKLTDDERFRVDSALVLLDQAVYQLEQMRFEDVEGMSICGLPKDLHDRLREVAGRVEHARVMLGPQ